MAASAAFSYYQNGKYGTLPQNPTKDMEITQDMHLKMSKKIAQLTKVIYALNTKNDEHEAIVQGLKEQHEEEMQTVLAETKQKIAAYKDKLDVESMHQKKIESLESMLSAHERHRTTAVRQFEHYKKEAEDREMRLKTEHSHRILEMSQDVLQTKKDFEERLNQFEKWKDGINEEKEKALKELKEAHSKELEDLRNFYKCQDNDWLNNVSEIEEKYKKQILSLEEKYDALNLEKSKLAEDYEAKLTKAQLFYEKELEAMKNMNSVSQDDAQRMLEEEKERLRKVFGAQEIELRKQLKSVISQLAEKEDEVIQLHKHIEQLTSSLNDKDVQSTSLSKQLQEAKKESIKAITELKQAESELFGMKERCARQEDELLTKSKLIGQLEATKLQNESLMADLQSELNKLKDRLAWMDKERNNLEKQKSNLSAEQGAQLKSLESALEDLSIEKQTMKERYEKELESLRQKMKQSEKDLRESHETEIKQVKQTSKEELQRERQAAGELLASTKQELMTRHQEEMDRLNSEMERLRTEQEKIQADLTNQLKHAEEEVARLDRIVKDSEQGLGSATGVINNLKEASNRLRADLDKAIADYKAEKSKAASLQAELDKLKLVHESKMKEASIELKTKLDKLSADLEDKWSETLRVECKKLRDEISQQKDSEMRAALQQLAQMKDNEIEATRQGWEAKIQDLMRQISGLKTDLLNRQSQTQGELDSIRAEAESEKRRLEEELLKAADDYLLKIQALEAMHEEKVRKLIEEKDAEREIQERQLKDKHLEDMKVQLSAHSATLQSVREQAETQRQTDLQAQRMKHNQTVEELRISLNESHASELDQRKRDYESHLNAARMELERAVEISRQKERDHAMRVEELQGEISQRERHIINLKEDASKLQTSINHLNKEIDFKRQEVQKIRGEAQNQIRLKEEQMLKKMETALDNLQADHLRESQELVNQFNEAQELLKDKISELQIRLEEAEERYRNRDSRPEDLELIHQLREAVTEREERMKALIEEKKYYQMELVNRETNFNKVFNSSPNVGVLNPLAVKKKKGDKGPMKMSSAPSLSGRLDPLPNSPSHFNQLNPAKPLPNFTKKFVS